MSFSLKIIDWFTKNKRSLPWRNSKNPYKIWLSEIILQQTKVAQGLPFYNKFICNYPTVAHLAKATENEVLKLWQGLGYYSRARNLHYTAKEIVKKYNGVFPKDYNTILKLKGVGTYTASAICSFAYNLPFAVVDGNVIRLLSRYFGIATAFDSSDGKKEFQLLAQKLLIKDSAAENNQAIMEFGALQCTPKSPNCNICPMQNSCFAFNNHLVNELPKKSKKLKIRKRYFEFLIINENKKLAIQKRKNGIWKGLYQFPLIENTNETTENTIIQSKDWKNLFNNKATNIMKISSTIKHQLTHQTIYARFWHISTKPILLKNTDYIRKEDIKKYPIPKLLEKYLEKIGMI
ncbi:MAG: A/G-specific adenine glycosylase [Flavobacteriales bacterium]|nr:A/G-specific adenine glycosylase [Flavobacteriales bacterium]